MPLKKAGSKVLAKMKKEYGARKGASVFYAKANKDKKWGTKMHAKRKPAKKTPPKRRKCK